MPATVLVVGGSFAGDKGAARLNGGKNMGLLHRVLSRLVEILNNKEVGLRLNENGEPICYYCGRPLDDGPNTHLEHVYPRSAGEVGAARNFGAVNDAILRSTPNTH